MTVYSKSLWIEVKTAVSGSVQVFIGKIDKPHRETAYGEHLNPCNFKTLAYSSNILGTLVKPYFTQYGTNYISAIAL